MTHIPGTTRDAVDDCIIRDGVLLRLVDTAGIREKADEVEHIGISRAKAAARDADMTLFVIDKSAGITKEDREIFSSLGENTLIVLNKGDLPPKTSPDEAERIFGREVLETCAISGQGREQLLSSIKPPEISDAEDVVITSERHFKILKEAEQSLRAAIDAFDTVDLDCVTIDIKDAWDSLGEITGVTVTEEIINSIFERFCLGK